MLWLSALKQSRHARHTWQPRDRVPPGIMLSRAGRGTHPTNLANVPSSNARNGPRGPGRRDFPRWHGLADRGRRGPIAGTCRWRPQHRRRARHVPRRVGPAAPRSELLLATLVIIYGNMLRAVDCPNAGPVNRKETVDLRLLADHTAVHSDMIAWHPNEQARASSTAAAPGSASKSRTSGLALTPGRCRRPGCWKSAATPRKSDAVRNCLNKAAVSPMPRP